MNRDKEIIKTSAVGIAGNILLVIAKAIIGILAGAVSIILDAVNNLTDALSSTVTIIGTKLSSKKPNKKHPYGFGRIEYVTSSIIGMIIFVAGAMAIYEAIKSLIAKEAATYSIYSFIVVSIAILAKIALGLFFKKKGKGLNSDALSASGLDALLDSLLSFGTLVGAILSYCAGISVEGYIGLVIGVFIIRTAIEVFTESISKIIGERIDPKFIKDLKKDIMQIEEVKGIYDLIISNYGNDKNIGSMHVEVDDKMKAREIQMLERKIATISYEKYNTIMTVGVYASNEDCQETKYFKEKVFEILNEYPQILQMHGFYCDPKEKTISFDMIVSFDTKNEQEVYAEIKEKVESIAPGYEVFIVLDNDFSVSE